MQTLSYRTAIRFGVVIYLLIRLVIRPTGCVSLAEEYHTTTACFSSDKCGYFNLECSHGQIIQIKELLYGWKLVKDPLCANISTNCANSKLCCSHNESDTLKNFTKYQAHDIFKRCSGKASCNDVRATSNFLDPSKPDTLSSYVVVRHTCIPRSSVINMCANATLEQRDTNAIFDPGTALYGVTHRRLIQCRCAIQSYKSFNTSVVEARMACNKTIYCEHPQVLGLTGLTSNCVSNEIQSTYFSYQKYYGSGLGPDFSLTFDSMCPPRYLWLQFKGGDNLTVTCRRLLLQEITTTTTTTTTTIPPTSVSRVAPRTSSILDQSKIPNEQERTTVTDRKPGGTDKHKSVPGGISTTIWIAIGAGAAGIILISCIGYYCWSKRRAKLLKTVQLEMEKQRAGRKE